MQVKTPHDQNAPAKTPPLFSKTPHSKNRKRPHDIPKRPHEILLSYRDFFPLSIANNLPGHSQKKMFYSLQFLSYLRRSTHWLVQHLFSFSLICLGMYLKSEN